MVKQLFESPARRTIDHLGAPPTYGPFAVGFVGDAPGHSSHQGVLFPPFFVGAGIPKSYPPGN